MISGFVFASNPVAAQACSTAVIGAVPGVAGAEVELAAELGAAEPLASVPAGSSSSTLFGAGGKTKPETPSVNDSTRMSPSNEAPMLDGKRVVGSGASAPVIEHGRKSPLDTPSKSGVDSLNSGSLRVKVPRFIHQKMS